MTLTVPEAARRTGRNPETIRRWIREGKLPSRKVGTQHMIEEDDLDAVDAWRPLPRADADRMLSDQSWSRRCTRVARNERSRSTRPSRTLGAAGRAAVTTDPWLPMIVGRIVRLVDPVKIVLFGSRARGGRPGGQRLRPAGDRRGGREPSCDEHRHPSILRGPAGGGGRRGGHDQEADGRTPGRPAGVVYWALQEGRVAYDRGNVA